MKRLFCIALLCCVSGCMADFITALRESTQADRGLKETFGAALATMGSNSITSGDILKGLGLSAAGMLLGGGGGHLISKNGRGRNAKA